LAAPLHCFCSPDVKDDFKRLPTFWLTYELKCNSTKNNYRETYVQQQFFFATRIAKYKVTAME